MSTESGNHMHFTSSAIRLSLVVGLGTALLAWVFFVGFLLFLIPPDPQIPIALFLSPVVCGTVGLGAGLFTLTCKSNGLNRIGRIVLNSLSLALLVGPFVWFIGELFQMWGYW